MQEPTQKPTPTTTGKALSHSLTDPHDHLHPTGYHILLEDSVASLRALLAGVLAPDHVVDHARFAFIVADLLDTWLVDFEMLENGSAEDSDMEEDGPVVKKIKLSE